MAVLINQPLADLFGASCLEGAADRAGVYVHGGSALTLLHRRDIRVGIASGMFLKTFVPDRSKRIEILTMLYLAY